MDAARREKATGGVVRSSERTTLGEYLDRWLLVIGPSVRPRTLGGYEIHVRRHIVPRLGRVRLWTLTGDDVQLFLNQLLADSISPKYPDGRPATVAHVRSTLRIALGRALETGKVTRNVVLMTKAPRRTKYTPVILDAKETKVLLEAARGDRLEALYVVAARMGLRLGECLGLHWEDVDCLCGLPCATPGRLHVRHGLQRIERKLNRTDVKTTSSRRSLKMPQEVAARLREHHARQRSEGAITPWVFCTYKGTPIDPRQALREFRTLLAAAGLDPRVRFHDLRHSCASLLLSRGVPITTVSKLLGHSGVTVTMGTYAHTPPSEQDESATVMDALYGQS